MSLNTELHKLVPLAKNMHLLSSNAVCSAARAGSEGDAFRVLTQDIQLLGEEVSDCISDTQTVINDIVLLASDLALLFSSYNTFRIVINNINTMNQPRTSKAFFEVGQESILQTINDSNFKLYRLLKQLTSLLEPVATLVKKGEYLSVCSSVEAANSGQHSVSFDAVSTMLRELVEMLNTQSMLQRSLLRDLVEAMDKQRDNLRSLANEG